MSTIDVAPAGYPAEIIGYAEPWIVSPGDAVEIKISCTEPNYKYRTVRIIQGVNLEHSPKEQKEILSQCPAGTGTGRFQLARPGSYALVKNWFPSSTRNIQGLDISFYFQPWLPEAGHYQTLLSSLEISDKKGFALVINEKGSAEFWSGNGREIETINTNFKPQRKRWSKVNISWCGTDLTISIEPLSLFAASSGDPLTFSHKLTDPIAISHTSELLFAASNADDATKGWRRATNFFNGRLDSPCIRTMGQTPITLVKFDFSRAMSTDTIVDVSGNGRNGNLVNAPTRAVKGHDWDGTENDWTKAQYGYGAIHFHEDDLDDAAWQTDIRITIPADARSGAYAVEVESDKASDSIPFFVRPNKKAWAEREGKVAFVISTFTYLAYANEQLWNRKRISSIDVGPGFDINDITITEDFEKMRRRTDLGLSNYDVHNDGSGVVYSSAKRPILNMRPNYVMWAWKRPREFSADTMMIGFLEREGIPYEIVTDHDLHEQGVAAIQGFNTVITGSHPEYPSVHSYNAYTVYAKQGGNLVYLGGNGFYWVTSTDIATRPHRMEIRRGDQGARSYEVDGGERIHSLDGQQGSLWRSRGRACNVLFAIGFAGEGAAPGVPYARSQLSKTDDSVAWIFENIGKDEILGEYGLGGGASGDEMDRFDVRNGSPETAKVLASSTGHPDEFGIVPEDAPFPITNTLGTQNPLIRSDLTYYINCGGGGVFSMGSINWCCSLGWDDYKNNIATLTGNVIKGFLKGRR
ncbi:uncharacterized protein Z520_04785 [Fonsecaea multimorphosa CBS 102226]|uniref:N,N-dimethylformamidase beta subunit-like C-terminal domain-containing protein n=1 Tax=Fonsecaea multimorphosa CBS 102226 TaxID=1442371 RepID=A0A0D2K7Q7_9EURO|nr:uncharacterized protein Z520_04785 [Fonsecaea multimorphosa CBS 102226]KIX99209.1 hypothetical protein Z520_04785 [Fonsecaea multimorphosa CBS 102226]OAL25906.1 hypothetical protein AYO22_04533 [Fonsecaea multimorphosa]